MDAKNGVQYVAHDLQRCHIMRTLSFHCEWY